MNVIKTAEDVLSETEHEEITPERVSRIVLDERTQEYFFWSSSFGYVILECWYRNGPIARKIQNQNNGEKSVLILYIFFKSFDFAI